MTLTLNIFSENKLAYFPSFLSYCSLKRKEGKGGREEEKGKTNEVRRCSDVKYESLKFKYTRNRCWGPRLTTPQRNKKTLTIM
jgi:hypothetical protein